MITSNIHSPSNTPRTSGFYSAFLSAQGRVLHDVIVYPDSTKPDDGFLIEVDAAEAQTLEKHIKRYKLRAKFAVRLLEGGEMGVWALWGDKTQDVVERLGRDGRDGMVMADPRCAALGYRMITSDPRPEVDLPEAPESAYTIRRYLLGIPEGQKEILREQALPLESNMDIMGGIDFRKGCYVGQELTIRTKHRGVVRKRILPVMIYPEDGAAPEELVYSPGSLAGKEGGFAAAEEIPAETSIGRVEKKGRSAGKWLAGVGNVGLALCRLEIMTDVVLPGEAAQTGWSATDEFLLTEKVEGDGIGRRVKIKAFVPAWLRQGLEEGHHSS